MSKLRNSFVRALEWRIISLILMYVILICNHIPEGKVGIITIETQVALFLGQVVWMWLRS